MNQVLVHALKALVVDCPRCSRRMQKYIACIHRQSVDALSICIWVSCNVKRGCSQAAAAAGISVVITRVVIRRRVKPTAPTSNCPAGGSQRTEWRQSGSSACSYAYAHLNSLACLIIGHLFYTFTAKSGLLHFFITQKGFLNLHVYKKNVWIQINMAVFSCKLCLLELVGQFRQPAERRCKNGCIYEILATFCEFGTFIGSI